MTNEEIAKIKAEVERLENYYTNVEWYVEALLLFLSTLEKQAKEVRNPIFDEWLSRVNPKVREEVSRNIDIEDELVRYFGRMPEDDEDKIELARHFAEWGAEHKQKDEQFPPVEGEYDQYPAAIYLPTPIPRMNKGDKVKIIIVKEDEKTTQKQPGFNRKTTQYKE